jgi:hypothetical protein
MTKDEALRLALEALEYEAQKGNDNAYQFEREAIKAALEAKDEPVKITHKHEWFRTGEMKVGQMRCISCGIWGQEEMPQRTWVRMTNEQFLEACKIAEGGNYMVAFQRIQQWLKEKNT